MKKKIRQCSQNELIDYFSQNLTMTKCDVERVVDTLFYLRSFGFMNKPLVNSKFLDIEIDIPEPHILDKEEHDYLRAVCKPYKVKYIKKTETEMGSQYIEIVLKSSVYCGLTEGLTMPYFTKDTMYKGMEIDKEYSIQDLELDKEWEE